MRIAARRVLSSVAAFLLISALFVPGAGATDVASAAAAAPRWSVQNLPQALGPASGQLVGVSCPTGTFCAAVGVAGSRALVEIWNGSSWKKAAVPKPAGATFTQFSGVSCTSASSCEAVGQYAAGSPASLALAEVWNGTTWAVQKVPDPAGTTNTELLSVSCASATSCKAVGDYQNSSSTYLTLAESLSGTTWTVQPTPNPSGAFQSELTQVSCAAAKFCAAVGFSQATSEISLVYLWKGSSWTSVTTPGTQFGLSGVSCATANACTVVGATGTATFAEAWNGSTWTTQSSPNPPAASDSVLLGVSCPASTSCIAVGFYISNSVTRTLSEVWNGSSWAIRNAPSPNGTSFGLYGVSCTSSSKCLAVRFFQATSAGTEFTLAEVWNGVKWVIRGPQAPTNNYATGVSCPSATSCIAVGYYQNGVPATLAASWNGTKWAIKSPPDPQTTDGSMLDGVSCTSAANCAAVGSYTNGPKTLTLAEAWNGSKWVIRSSPNAATATNVLDAVSCVSASFCIAVGESAGPQPLAELWNGTSWTLQTVPTTFVDSQLNGVSCASATNCVAVGSTDGGRLVLVEGWNGSTWSVESAPNPGGASLSSLASVSCPASTSCMATGSYQTSAATLALAESWNGTSWTIVNSPNPAKTVNSALDGVSCQAGLSCEAVGSYTLPTGGPFSLAEHWNGTQWSIQASPNPSGATNPSAVSCDASTSCAGVGSFQGITTRMAFAERYSG